MSPPVPGLEEVFVTARHLPECDEQHGYRIIREPCPLIRRDRDQCDEPVQYCRAGLQPLVSEWLRRAGHRVVEDAHTRLIAPQRDSLRGFGIVDYSLLDCVRRQERALVYYASGEVEPARLVAQVALAWPDARVMVFASRIADVCGLARRLRRFVPDVTAFHANSCPDQAGRIVVSTYACGGVGPIQIERREIAFAFNPDELVRRLAGWNVVAHSWSARMYGLLPMGTHLAPFDDDEMHAVFGYREISIPRHGCQEAKIHVAISKIEGGGPPVGNPPDLTTLLRRGVWQHPVRNRRIARLAEALAEDDHDFLKDRYPSLAILWENLPPQRIAILVENLEHAETLVQLLPGWSIITGPTRGIGRKSILVGGGGPGIGCFEVVIRADAGVGLPANRRGNDFPEKVFYETCLIDFDDRHHPALRRRSRSRRQAYARASWTTTPGQDPASQLDRFLATRPKELAQ